MKDIPNKEEDEEVSQIHIYLAMFALINDQIPDDWGPTTARDMINADRGFLVMNLLTTVNRILGNRNLNELEHFDVISGIISEKIELMTIVEFNDLPDRITNDSLLAFVNDRVREAEELLNE